ncbi:MAG: hypothetical protein JNL28_00050 [Planctomycetes bacterium]|nr:hypothetical protein [Planctomycetota bacterium]
MSLGKLVSILALGALFFPAFGCSSKGTDEATNTITNVLQDLTLDASGATTVVTFSSTRGLSGATLANFECDTGQLATGVTVSGSSATIVWDTYVSPSSRVRVVGRSGISGNYFDVSTSSTTVPTFTIANGTQTSSLGGDSFDVVFSGTHVVESDVEDLSKWTLTINSTNLDLTGSTIVFNPTTQEATFTLGTMANLHANFTVTADGVRAVSDAILSSTTVAGTATGDTTAPTLVSATQNLTEDEFGRVVDFLFSEPMDPVFSVQLSHFGVTSPDIAVTVTRPTDDTLRVAFNNPIVPGLDTVSLTSLVDAHGVAFVDAVTPITQPSPVANAYASTNANTVANAGGDNIVVVTTQAFDPDTAEDPAAWSLFVDFTPVDLTQQTLSYDLATKTLTIALNFDMQNGDAFDITGVSVVDVDGQTFTLTSLGSAGGDVTAPTIGSVVQNRNIDSTGKTLVVQFSEHLEQTTAETTSNWAVSGAQNLTTATLLGGGDSVRLEFDALVVPGDVTLSAQNVTDLAGNAMATAVGVTIGKTDVAAPSPVTVLGTAVEGAFDDTVAVVFDDDMIPAEVTNPDNWSVESPTGNLISTTGDLVTYDTNSKTATLTLQNAGNLQRGDDVRVVFSGCRDLAGNTVNGTGVTGTITSETSLPVVQSIYRDSVNLDQLVVTFSEPCANAGDLYNGLTNIEGVRYILRTSGGALRGTPTAAAPSVDLNSVRLTFGFVVDSTDTLDIAGVVDMCGNPQFPDFARTTVAQDTTVPSLSTGTSLVAALSGENNDVMTITFDRPMSPFRITDKANYSIVGPATVDLENAQLRFDGVSTVTVGLRNFVGHDVQTGASYTITANNVWSAQGVKRTTVSTDAGLIAIGDSASPTVSVGNVKLDPVTANSILIEADEALDIAAATNPAAYDYDSGNIATAAELVGPRVVRVTFGVTPIIGQNVQFTAQDLAGNATGTITRAVAAADTTAPLVVSVAGLAVPNRGRDTVTVVFDEQVDTAYALTAANYAITNGSRTLNPALAILTYDSTSRAVTMRFPQGQELDANASISVTVQNIRDLSGNVMGAPVVLVGAVTGDTFPPSIYGAFVNLRTDPTGRTIDVSFDEDVDETFVGTSLNWSASGGPTVTTATVMEGNRVRLVLTGALGVFDAVGINNLPDLANNIAGALLVDPFE